MNPIDLSELSGGVNALDKHWDEHRSKRAEGKPQGEAVTALTDLGNAERLAKRHGQDIRYCHPMGKWFVWNGCRFKPDATAEVMQRAKETTRAIPEEATRVTDPKAYAAILDHAIKSESLSKQTSMVSLAANEPDIGIEPGDLDRDPWLFNVQNGTINLRTGEKRPHRRDDLITKLAPVAFDAVATCPRFERFMLEVMCNRPHLVAYLQRVLGYALTADIREQVLFFLHGDGSNGKSTLLKLILDLMGDYAKQAVSDLLMAKNTEAHPTEVAELVGKRMVICTEIGEGKTLDEVRTKQLTGGDKMKGRFMRQDFFDFDPTHKIFLASNPKPNVRGADFAIWRRIHLIPFERKFADAEKDPLLLEKLKLESSGILNWLIKGCLEWQRIGLNPPDEVKAATEQYRNEEDLLSDFFAERCVLEHGCTAESSKLYAAYQAWAKDLGLKATLSQKALGRRLKLKGLEQGRMTRGPNSGRSIWVGIGLRDTTYSTEGSADQSFSEGHFGAKSGVPEGPLPASPEATPEGLGIAKSSDSFSALKDARQIGDSQLVSSRETKCRNDPSILQASVEDAANMPVTEEY